MSKCDYCMKHRDCLKTANYKLIAKCTEFMSCDDCEHFDGIDYPEGACVFCTENENLEKRTDDGYCPKFQPRGQAQ